MSEHSYAPPVRDCVSWQLKYFHGRKPGEREFRLEQDGIVRRKVYCPSIEDIALGDALTGREYPLSQKLIELCKDMPVIDIGAHCGGTAVYWEEMLKPSELHCFEPHPTAFEYLKENVSSANLYQAAVSGSGGQSEYFVRDRIFWSGLYENGAPSDKIQVPLTSGRAVLMNVLGEIGLLKIDAEKSEVPILYSAIDELPRVRVVYVEYHDEHARRMIDQMMRGFTVFSHQSMFGLDQGTVGYVRDDVKHLVFAVQSKWKP